MLKHFSVSEQDDIISMMLMSSPYCFVSLMVILWNYSMKAFWKVELYLHEFLTFALDGGRHTTVLTCHLFLSSW